MAETKRSYKGSLSFGQLDTALEAHEMLFGTIVKLEAIGELTVATYDDSEYPPLQSLALMPLIGEGAPPAGNGATHLFNGEAIVIGVKVGVAIFRTN